MTKTKTRQPHLGVRTSLILTNRPHHDFHIDRLVSGTVSGACCSAASASRTFDVSSRLNPGPHQRQSRHLQRALQPLQPPCMRMGRLRQALKIKARLLPGWHRRCSPLTHARRAVARDQPSFDVAVIGRAGDGYRRNGCAGLLWNCFATANSTIEHLDQSGQFVIVPTAASPGDCGLTLRSTQLDGKQATSQQNVAVSLKPGHKDQLDAALTTQEKASVALSNL